MAEQYEIHWEETETGLTGHGSATDEFTARQWVNALNKEHKGKIRHWLVKVTE